jgi:adenylate cyclase
VRAAPHRRRDRGGAGDAVGLTEADIARLANTTEERVRELVELGILVPGPDPKAPFRAGDALRAQLVEELRSGGVPPARIAEALSRGALSLGYLDRFPPPSPRSDRTYGELCTELEIPFDLLDRVYVGFGLPRPQSDERVREEDVFMIAGLPMMLGAGLGEGEVLRAARVWGEAARRVAEHQVHSFHEFMEEPFRRQGLSDDQVLDAALSQVGVRVVPYVHQLAPWLHRRHFERYAIAHRRDHVETALQRAGLQREPAPHPEAVVFADLSGYTKTTEQLGDRAAARLALDFAALIQDVADTWDGRVVKMLGDGVHFFFHEPKNAVLGALDFVDKVVPHGLPEAHVGVNAGPMIYTDGDYYGLAVNVAARIASEAAPGQVLVGEAAVADGAPAGVQFERIGPVALKGVSEPVTLFRAIRNGSLKATGTTSMA